MLVQLIRCVLIIQGLEIIWTLQKFCYLPR